MDVECYGELAHRGISFAGGGNNNAAEVFGNHSSASAGPGNGYHVTAVPSAKP